MTQFVLTHQHAPAECGPAMAAWKGFHSALSGRPAPASCVSGGHCAWWQVDAPDAEAALAQLPPYVAARAQAHAVREVTVP